MESRKKLLRNQCGPVETQLSLALHLAAGGLAARRTSHHMAERPEVGLLPALRPGENQATAAWHTARRAHSTYNMSGQMHLFAVAMRWKIY